MKSAWIETFKMDQSTGVIGDTIGGITTPVFGFLSAILIYYSFREQFRANQEQILANAQQKEALKAEIKRNNLSKEYDQIISLFDVYLNEINSFSLENEYGIDVINNYAKDNIIGVQSIDYATSRLALTFGVFRMIILKVHNFASYITVEDRELIETKHNDLEMLRLRIEIEYKRIGASISLLCNEGRHQQRCDYLRNFYMTYKGKTVLDVEGGIEIFSEVDKIKILNDVDLIYDISKMIRQYCETIP
jgi:hypothetical protein